jgi:hypothetical protein
MMVSWTVSTVIEKMQTLTILLVHLVEESDATAEMLKSVQAEIQAGRRQGALRTEHSVLKPFAVRRSTSRFMDFLRSF